MPVAVQSRLHLSIQKMHLICTSSRIKLNVTLYKFCELTVKCTLPSTRCA